MMVRVETHEQTRGKTHAMDALIARIEEKGNPTALGLDTSLSYLPQDFAQSVCPSGIQTLECAARAILAYNAELIKALRDIVPCVKVQAAYYEQYGPAGMQAFRDTIELARQAGLTVIADVKRGDIGATAAAYSAAYLGETPLMDGVSARAFACDMVTVNPYLGSDGVKPFVDDCEKYGRGIFALVKTSNPSSGELQDLACGETTVYERMAAMVAQWGRDLIGERGYSAVGAVVGATYPAQGVRLRAMLPNTFFLVPGYGAQGATARDLAGCFDARGGGAIVNASRSILCAWQKRVGKDAFEAAREEALRMREDIRAALP